ncbi:MAG: hypothetical protein IPL40_12180 [Proteobacteria bacterium]|nr:hypothetical protein [Pseudomonadota bacterium]
MVGGALGLVLYYNPPVPGLTRLSTQRSALALPPRSRPTRLCGCTLSAALVVSGLMGSAAAARRWTANAEAGPEYDSNALRVAGDDRSRLLASPLLRISGDLALALGAPTHALALSYSGGGKLFLRGGSLSAADEYVQRALLAGSWGLAGLRLGLHGSYYEVFQPTPDDGTLKTVQRDLRLASASLRASWAQRGGWPALVLDAGYQGLHFKPNAEFDFHGPLGSVAARWRWSTAAETAASAWTLGATFTLGRRWFSGQRTLCRASEQGGCIRDPSVRRADWDQLLWFQLGYEGPATAAWWYGLELNGSNSDNQRYLRHIVGMRFTVPIIWAVYASLESVVQVSSFRRSAALEPTGQPFNPLLDEENRSRLGVYLGRELSARWSLVARWAVYVNESIAATTALTRLGFVRQTALLALRFAFDSDAR